MFDRKLNLMYDERVTFIFFPNLTVILIIARNIDAKFEESQGRNAVSNEVLLFLRDVKDAGAFF